MAKRNSMSTARRSRNRKQEPTPQSSNTIANERLGDPAGGWAPPRNPALVAKIISDGQIRLMKAQAVLGCVEFALVYEDWLDRSQRPSFADAVAVAQDLVSEAIAQLARA